MGVGDSRLNAPLFTVTGMGESAADSVIQLDPGTTAKREVAEIITAVGNAVEKEAKRAAEEISRGAADLLIDAANEVYRIMRSPFNACEDAHGPIGREISATMNRIVKTLLGYPTGQNYYRTYFRLGEALAKATPSVRRLGWEYAGGYYEYNVIKADQEGSDFKNYKQNSDKNRRSFKDRWKVWPDEGNGEVGKCDLKRVMRDTLATAAGLESALVKSANQADRRLMFVAWMAKWLPGGTWDASTGVAGGWCKGMEFLLRDAAKSPLFISSADAYLRGVTGDAPTPSTPSASTGGGYTPTTSGGIGGGGLLTIAAVGLGTYFLVKG